MMSHILPDEPVTGPPESSVMWQEGVVRPAATIFSIGGLAVMVLFISMGVRAGWRTVPLASLLGMLVMALVRRATWKTLSWLFVITLAFIGVTFPSFMGLRFSPMLVAALAVTVAASLLGRRVAALVLAVVAVSLIGTGYGVSRGWFVLVETESVTTLGSWIRAAVLFSCVAAALAALVSAVVRSLQRNLDQKKHALASLVRLAAEREQAERGLVESEAYLRQAEEKYRSLFEHSLHGIYQTTPAGAFITANTAMAHILGYASAEELTEQMTDVASQGYASAEGRAEFLRLLARDGVAHGLEYEARCKDGSRRWVSEDARVVRDAAGAIRYYEGTLTDITDRMRAQQALQDSEKLLKETQAIAGLGSYVLDIPTGRWSSSALLDGIFGIDGPFERSVEGWASLIHPESRERMRRYFADEVLGQHRRFDMEYQIIRRSDGQARWVHGLGQLEFDAHGNPLRMIGTINDITERRQAEQQFLRAQRMESIGTLAGGIAHDLNNVLAPIVMSIDLLKMTAKDDDSRSLLDTIGASARRGADLVGQVLSFARGIEGRRVEVQVRHLIREMEKIARETFPKNIQVRTMVSRDVWTVLGDPTQLHQVLLNLCINARDAMPEGGQITITADNVTFDAPYAALNIDATAGPHVVIQVEDTGMGIPPAVLDKIFDPFFTTKEIGKGTGLGLSTSLTIVKGHGGFLRVSSEPGAGARFRVCLPAQPESHDARTGSAAAELPRGDGETVLVVDDEAAIREIARHTLEAFGYRVLLASDGAEAVALYAQHADTIAVVVTDMMMPVMDGASAIQVLVKMNPAVRIIAVSGLATSGQVPLKPEGGVIQFLSKPYSSETLLQALRESLGKEPKGNLSLFE